MVDRKNGLLAFLLLFSPLLSSSMMVCSCSEDSSYSAENDDDDTETDAGEDTGDESEDTEEGCEFTCSEHCASIGGEVMDGSCEEDDYQCCDLSEAEDTEDDDTEDEGSGDYPMALRTPITTDIYTADPSAHVFDGVLYVYPSHDEDYASNGFDMRDYHVFSLDDNGDFVDHGMILSVDDVPWASRDMWAPDAAYKDGTYYFYFPAKDQEGIFRIGVASSDSPTGPFSPESGPMEGTYSIDPCVFIDDDGSAYMYVGGLWGGQLECWQTGTYQAPFWGDQCNGPSESADALGPLVARLSDNMTELDGELSEVSILSASGSPISAGDNSKRFFEGAWMHKYDGTYYLSYSTGDTQRIVYATGDSPSGPFTYQGIVLPEHNSGWTTHHSIVEFEGNWYLFYHDSTCSGDNTNRRCVKVADLHYNEDGTIQTVSLR